MQKMSLDQCWQLQVSLLTDDEKPNDSQRTKFVIFCVSYDWKRVHDETKKEKNQRKPNCEQKSLSYKLMVNKKYFIDDWAVFFFF